MTSPTDSLHGAADMPLTPSGQRAGADSGDPQVSVAEIFNDGKSQAGVWQCTPGGWSVNDRPDTETATILSGKGVITDNSGRKTDIGPGSIVTLPRGWTGRWDITETVRKVYVIVK